LLGEPEIVVHNRRKSPDGVYVGRPTALGSPFEIGKDGSREEVIAKYRVWLEDQLETDSEAARMFVDLWDFLLRDGELELSCWCKPLACHADVIREFLLEAWKTYREGRVR